MSSNILENSVGQSPMVLTWRGEACSQYSAAHQLALLLPMAGLGSWVLVGGFGFEHTVKCRGSDESSSKTERNTSLSKQTAEGFKRDHKNVMVLTTL
jgi:hypothetical protein